MEALVIYQPWASLIMLGLKPYELRRWDFSGMRRIGQRWVRGRTDLVGKRIVIVAGARAIQPGEMIDLKTKVETDESVVSRGALPLIDRILAAHKCQGVLPLGVGLGTVRLGQPKSVAQLFTGTRFFDSDRANHQLFAWPVEDPKPFPEPVPMRGQQGFFTWAAPVPEECL